MVIVVNDDSFLFLPYKSDIPLEGSPKLESIDLQQIC